MLQRKLLNVAWVSTNPMPLNTAMTSCPATDWRFPHVLQRYNEIAETNVNLTHGRIKYIDLFSIAFHLFDLSYDGSHYQGPVGFALASRILDSLKTKT